MIRIITKLPLTAAKEKAKEHKVNNLEYLGMNKREDWLTFECENTFDNRMAMCSWFIDCPPNPPFPAGSCLFYTW